MSAMSAAHAAKLCLVAPNSYTYFLSDYTWAVGLGCKGTSYETAGITSGSVATSCTTTMAVGEAACADQTAGVDDSLQGYTDWTGSANKPKGGPGGMLCFCRMISPKRGAWVPLSTIGSASSCAMDCAYYCVIHVHTNAAFRSAVLGQPGF
jgi:hypothetical protein